MAKKSVKKIKKLDPKVMQKDVNETGVHVTANLHKIKFGLALGILCAFAMVFLSLWVMNFGTGQEIIDMTAQFYVGYSTTYLGMVLGAVYGFIDGFVGGYVFAWIYNKLL